MLPSCIVDFIHSHNSAEPFKSQEQKLIREIEELQAELAPLEQRRRQLAELADKRSNNLIWLGLGMMSVQFGVLARLTWWEYSWDIMEPGKNVARTRTRPLINYVPFFVLAHLDVRMKY